ncbi:MAG: primosomal protein N' [Pyrinomonadaceae bacterium]
MSTPETTISAVPTYVEAALPVPLRRVFTYRIPEQMRASIKLGARLLLPFGRRSVTGYAVGLHAELPPDVEIDESKIKDVIELTDEVPLITPEILKLTQWTADYYASFWGEMLKASLPAGINSEKVRPKRRKAVRLVWSPGFSRQEEPPEGGTPNKPLTGQQQKIVDLLTANGGEMLFTDVLEQADSNASPLNTLAKRGVVEIYVQDVMRDPLAGAALPLKDDFELTAEQQTALDSITTALTDGDKFKSFLLHGVTGSGKTEVYIRAMRFALDAGRSAMMLVPEIALTPVFSRRLRTVFGSEVAILHSNLSVGERYDEWRRIRRGDARIAIGTRSAVFAPLENIGLVIVDEEHDPSYRQHESPFYNARDVAVMRAHLAGAVVVLGSATPAMESFFNAQTGKYTYLSLPERIGGRGLATAELIDMRLVFKRAGRDVPLSFELLSEIEKTRKRGEQVIILLNRRGFSQFVLCRTCGETLKCPNCDITLTFHRGDNKLLCHYCNHREKSPKVCPHCQSEYLYFVGEGTENIADQLTAKFPEMRIARVDRDTMAHKGEMEDVLLKFAAGGLDMLVGTQMIAKGHDFPNVTLVGVISVDIGLGLPDLRSAERTFQLITQVAGRAGRGKKAGKVMIQTYYPDHYALRFAKEQDYLGFYNEEIKFRKRLAYPPFFVLASILIKHRDHAYASKMANILRRSLDRSVPPAVAGGASDRQVRILGPAPASLSRLKNEFRLQIILKGVSRRSLREILDIGLADAERQGCDLRTVNVEIDPVNLM